MHTLVTGGAGFIGSHMVDQLIMRGDDVRILDNLSSGRLEFINGHLNGGSVEFLEADLLNLEEVTVAMRGVDRVVHLAANPDIRLGTEITNTDLEQGTIATYNVLEAMRRSGVSSIGFASSSAVYGEAVEMPTSETYGPMLPISLYGASKLASEALCTSWSGTFGIHCWIWRFANIVGPRGTHGVIFDLIHKLKRDDSELEVLGDGRQEKSYMWVEDCVDAMLHTFESMSDGINIVNLGAPDTCSVRRIAELVIEESGFSDTPIRYTGGNRGWAGDVPKTYLSVSKLDSTGYRAPNMSEDAIRNTIRTLIMEIGLD